MKNFLEIAGTTGGWVGVLLCVIAGLARVTGMYSVGGYGSMVLFEVGVGLMVAAALATLHARLPRT